MTESRLTAIEGTLLDIRTEQARTNAILEGMTKQVQERVEEGRQFRQVVRDNIFGDVKDPGMITRLDRLEQGHKRQQWFVRTLLAAVLAAIVGAFRR